LKRNKNKIELQTNTAYRNAIEIMSKNKSDRRLIKVIKAPHLDKHWKDKNA